MTGWLTRALSLFRASASLLAPPQHAAQDRSTRVSWRALPHRVVPARAIAEFDTPRNRETKPLTDLEQATQQDPDCGQWSCSDRRAAELLQRQVAREFSRALNRAEKEAARGKPELAVEWCSYAATMAWLVNPGFFYSHEVEQLLAEIGRKHLDSGPLPARPVGLPQRFLHLMSTAYESGGHTRAVSRWIEICAQHAPSEHHSILISMQRDDPVPAWLGTSAEKTGGHLMELPPGLSRLQAASEIRLRAAEFDAVILHIHPNDPLPNIAFHDRPRPVLFFRHADHIFNLGLDVAPVFADLRPVGHAMSLRFCPSTARKVMLPIPLLDDGNVLCGKTDARKKLGLPADSLIALTVGLPRRFTPENGVSFPALVHSVCKANPKILIIAIGLTESDPFPGLSQSVGGRFLPIGVINDRDRFDLYYQAADIYMDAPGGSGTATLDAARMGLPVQRLFNPCRCLLWSEDPGLDSVSRAASNQEEFAATAQEWLNWPEQRRLDLGRRFRNAVLRDHCGASWKSNWLDPAVKALTLPTDSPPDSIPGSPHREELDFPGLGVADLEDSWPSSMFVACTINSAVCFPLPIRLSGFFHSIKPLLFSSPTAGGTMRQRLLVVRELIASFKPNSIRDAMRGIWRAALKR